MEDQKVWEISVRMSSIDCKFREAMPPDLSDGVYNNFGEVRCGHRLSHGMLCCFSRKEYCPIRVNSEYPLNPKNQVDINDV